MADNINWRAIKSASFGNSKNGDPIRLFDTDFSDGLLELFLIQKLLKYDALAGNVAFVLRGDGFWEPSIYESDFVLMAPEKALL